MVVCSFPSALGHDADAIITASLSGTVRLLLPFRDEANTEQVD